jgi:hypothetical protein
MGECECTGRHTSARRPSGQRRARKCARGCRAAKVADYSDARRPDVQWHAAFDADWTSPRLQRLDDRGRARPRGLYSDDFVTHGRWPARTPGRVRRARGRAASDGVPRIGRSTERDAAVAHGAYVFGRPSELSLTLCIEQTEGAQKHNAPDARAREPSVLD